VPFKHHDAHRRHIPKPRYLAANCREYDAALRRRGSLTLWFPDDAIAAWRGEPRTKPRGEKWNSRDALKVSTARRSKLIRADCARI
jgi:hypothetical protein